MMSRFILICLPPADLAYKSRTTETFSQTTSTNALAEEEKKR